MLGTIVVTLPSVSELALILFSFRQLAAKIRNGAIILHSLLKGKEFAGRMSKLTPIGKNKHKLIWNDKRMEQNMHERIDSGKHLIPC